jgi:cytochrome c-type biogenesis protein CcmH/NrfG
MTRESLPIAIAGTIFGFLVGWLIGSAPRDFPQSAGGPPTGTVESAPFAPAPASPPPIDERRVASLQQRAAADGTNASVRVELGNLYMDAERFQLAIPWFEQALTLTPRDISVSTDLGVCYYYTDQVDRALAQLDRSLAIDRKHLKTLLNQGIVRAFGKQDLAGAVAAWSKVVELGPGSDEARRADELLNGLRSAHPGTPMPSSPSAPTRRR